MNLQEIITTIQGAERQFGELVLCTTCRETKL